MFWEAAGGAMSLWTLSLVLPGLILDPFGAGRLQIGFIGVLQQTTIRRRACRVLRSAGWGVVYGLCRRRILFES